MRILHISSARTLGGGERHLIDLVGALAARGHEVYVALRPSSPLREALAALLPAPHLITLDLRNALDLKSGAGLARVAREKRIEIIHAHVARDYPLAAFAAWRAAGARLIITRHVLFPLNRLHALALARVARVIAVSAPVAAAVRGQRLFPARKICVIPNGVDLARFDPDARRFDRIAHRRGLSPDAVFVVGTVGELSHVKGQEDFIRAASIVVGRGEHAGPIDFLIAGEDASPAGRTRARLAGLIAEAGLSARVRLLGNRDDIASLLRSFDLFVSASRSEAFGLAIVEAMAAGVPVAATATEGAREIITDGVTGKLVPVGDPQALAAVIATLLGDATERHRLSTRARAMVRARFGLDHMVEATERVYRAALEERRGE